MLRESVQYFLYAKCYYSKENSMLLAVQVGYSKDFVRVESIQELSKRNNAQKVADIVDTHFTSFHNKRNLFHNKIYSENSIQLYQKLC